MKRNLPIATLSIALAGIVATTIPLVGQWLVFDRTAIIDGEIWRIVTGHLYHFSPLHLWCNLIPFVLIGASVERHSRSWFIVGCLMMAIAISVSLFFAHPSMVRFGGVSGLLCGLLTYYGFSGVRTGGRKGIVCRIALAVIILKTGYELYYSDALLVDWDEHGFVVMPLSHVVGCLSASLCILVQSVIRSDSMKSAVKVFAS